MAKTDTSNPASMVGIWRREFKDRAFLAESLLTLLLFIAVIRICSVVLLFIEARPGVPLPDPILAHFGPIRLTWFTFSILWTSLIIGICYLLHNPRHLVMGFEAASLILLFRLITLLLVPLEAPPTIIPMADPLIVHLGTNGDLVIKDLFFSGHTSVMFLLFLAAKKNWLKSLFLLGTIAVGIGVTLQHVHYSIDVFVAPFFAYTSWRIVVRLHEVFRARENRA